MAPQPKMRRTCNYQHLMMLLILLPLGAVAKREYPLWLLTQMPDMMHMRAAYNHYDDGFPVAAIEKFVLASRYGNLRSRVEIGRMYMEGDGVEQNMAMAYAWFALAEMTKETPWRNSRSPREQLQEHLTEKQRSEAATLLSSLVVEHGPEKVTKRILSWLRREKHKHRAQFSLISVGGTTVTRDQFFRQLRRYVVEVYLPDTEVRLQELEIIEDELDN